jgi:ASC-1-like (ASCH) protein
MKVNGLTPDKIGSYLEDLVEFSDEDDNGGNIHKLSEIPYYIEQMKNEKKALKQDIQNLQKQKKISEEEASLANELRDAALENEKVTVVELREYSKFKTELRKYGLSFIDDAQKLVRIIYGIKQRGYDVGKILSEYSDIEFMQDKRDMLSKLVRTLEDKIVYLQGQCSFLESQVNLHNQRLYVYDELKSMGLGIRELKIILNTIKEIAAENNIIDYRMAVDRFFGSLEQQYDIKLRQKTQKEEEQKKREYTKPDNLNPTFPSHHDITPSTTLPNQSSLVEKQQRQQLPSTSISYTYNRKITNASKKTEEQKDQLNNDHDDGWYESDDDHSL